MYCRQCGAPNDDNAWKCVQCGTELRGEPAPALTPTSSPSQPIVIPNYLWQSIVCTIFCCWPLGIPAIVYAAQVNGKIGRGDIEGAKASSKNAKMWCWIAFGTGLLVIGVYVILMVLGVVSNMHLGGSD
jgi:interferon-induced transmembrane protein/zinc ribbon protein